MSKLRIKVTPTGKVTTEVTGAPGGTCQKVSGPYKEVFAGAVKSDTPTAEANEPEILETETETHRENS